MRLLGQERKRRVIKCVIDTNVIISAIFNPKGIPGKIIEAWFKHEFLAVTSEFLLQELRRVLHYPHIQRIKLISENEINKFVHDIINISQLIEVSSAIDVVKKDATDNQVLATALDGQVNYIVSGDVHLLDLGDFRGIKIVKPIEFLNVLDKVK